MTASTPPAGHPEVSPASSAPAPSGAPPSAAAPGGRSALAGLILALLSVALYWPTLDHQLIYDDMFLIQPQQNRSMVPVKDDLGAAFDLFTQEYWEGVNPENTPEYKVHGQALYRPLTLFLWAVVQYYTFPESGTLQVTDGGPYHLMSLAANVLVVWLFFLVVLRLFGQTRLAFVAGLIYAVHPLHSEAVAYVAGLSDQLAAAAVLVGVLCFLRIVRSERGLPLGSLACLLVCFFLGLMAKESAVVTLAVVALTDIVVSLRGTAVAAGRRMAVYGGMLAVLAVQLWMRVAVIGYLAPRPETIGRLDNPMVVYADDFALRAANALKLVARYVWLVLWPQDLSIDYSYNAIPLSDSWTSPEPLAGAILCAAMLLVGLLSLRSRPALGWGLLFFLGTTIFISNLFVPIGTIFADRLMYLPTLGAALALAVVIEPLLGSREKGASNPVGLLILVLAVGALGWRTHERNQDFYSSRDVFEAAQEVVPESARVPFQLGSIYANEGRFNAAIEKLEESLDKDDTFLQAALQLGDVLTADRNFERAIGTYNQVLEGLVGSPSDPEQVRSVRALVLNKRATARRAAGDVDGALADLQEAMNLGTSETPAPVLTWARIQRNQGRAADTIPVLRQELVRFEDDVDLLMALARAAVAAADKEAYDEAVERLRTSGSDRGRARALRLDAEVAYERAALSRDPDGKRAAMSMFLEALELDDSLATAHYYQGRFMIETDGAFAEGLGHFDAALERDPQHVGALRDKADVLIRLQRYDEALETLALFETAMPDNVDCQEMIAEAAFLSGDTERQEAAYARLEELGEVPIELTLQRAVAYRDQGDVERGLEVLNQALADPESAAEPMVLRTHGDMLMSADRCQEALGSFELQALAEDQRRADDPDFLGDPFLPINRARAMGCAGMQDQALAELAALEARLDSYADQPQLQVWLRGSLLHRRCEILLEPGGSAFDAAAGLTTAEEGLEITARGSVHHYDMAIEAYVANDDLASALTLANEAATRLFGYKHFPVVVTALEQAGNGDRAGAADTLRAYPGQREHEDGPRNLERLARHLEG